jgi:hypothetical protein
MRMSIVDGRVLWVSGTHGRGANEYNIPSDIVCLDEWSAAVADFGNHRVKIISTRNGSTLGVLPIETHIRFLQSLALTHDSRLLALSTWDESVFEIRIEWCASSLSRDHTADAAPATASPAKTPVLELGETDRRNLSLTTAAAAAAAAATRATASSVRQVAVDEWGQARTCELTVERVFALVEGERDVQCTHCAVDGEDRLLFVFGSGHPNIVTHQLPKRQRQQGERESMGGCIQGTATVFEDFEHPVLPLRLLVPPTVQRQRSHHTPRLVVLSANMLVEYIGPASV